MFKQYAKDLRSEFLGYNLSKFRMDLFAGLTVCAVALPLALAFGVSSGADAAAGLITAILSGIIISALSGASFQISGPTGAMTAILIPLAAKYQLQGVFMVGLLAGIILLLAAFMKAGKLVTCIPTPVVTGFTSGIAIIIALGQIDNLFGVKSTGHTQIEKIISYFQHGFPINWYAVGFGLLVIAIMLIYPRKLSEKMPSSLVAIILAIGVQAIFKFDVAMIGEIPKSMISENRLNLLDFDYTRLSEFVVPAVSVAALAMIESLLCGTCGGKLKGEKLDADREILSQGIGNIIIPFFGGVPATAAIARTSVAIKSGCQTRLTGVIHALGLIASMFLLGNVMSIIPLSALAGVLIVTAWRMNEWESIHYIFSKKFKGAISKFFITMAATVVFDLTLAIAIGIGVGLVLFTIKITNLAVSSEKVDFSRLQGENSREGVVHDKATVIYLVGPLYFLTSERLLDAIESHKDQELIIFSMRGVPLIDITAVQALTKFCEDMHESGSKVVFAGVQQSVMQMLDRSSLKEVVGEDAFYWSVDRAIVELDLHKQVCNRPLAQA